MVDSGPLHPESLAPGTASHSGDDSEQAELLSLSFLMQRLDAESEQVQMWAAYQLVDRWQHACEAFVERLWNSPHEEIRESAIHLIGKYDLQQYAFPLLRVFRSGEPGLRAAAGMALGRLRYEPALRLLQAWLEEALTADEVNTVELEAAAEALLLLEPARTWDALYDRLGEYAQHHTVYSVLFGQLAAHASTTEHVGRLAGAYAEPRRSFHDVHLTQHLVELIGRANVTRYLQARLNAGYPLTAVYQECLRVLGVDAGDPGTAELLNALGECRNTRSGMQRFLRLAGPLLDHLAPGEAQTDAARAFLAGCEAWVASWDEAILKVREVEYHLIVSLPLATVLNAVEARCLADPDGEALRITRIYQSPLLSPRFMVQVLTLFSRHKANPDAAGLEAMAYAGWVRDEEKDALWKLFTNQLEGVDYPFEQVLPQPWLYPVPSLLEKLTGLLTERFGAYLRGGRKQAVDFCLEVFRRRGSQAAVPLLLEHFDALINHHHRDFVEVMTHLPDLRFLEPLQNHYREGEPDLLRLIHFICDVHDRPYPARTEAAPPEPAQEANTALVRLLCERCGGAYHYALHALYVDEERMEQRQVPGPQDLWVPEPFTCKNCGAEVPLEPDERFLSDLFAELLAARLFRLEGEEAESVRHVRLIQFPRYEGRTTNPDEFMRRVESARGSEGEDTTLLLELGRFQMEIGEAAQARQTFQRLLSGRGRTPIALYYLGVIAFQEKNLYEARVYFSRLVQGCTREDFPEELDNPVDMAHHYLKLLDRRDFKRSHFHLVTS